MHSVVGGGEMKRPAAAGSTYLRPHVVHSHQMRGVSASGVSAVENLRGWMRWVAYMRSGVVWLPTVTLEGWFPILIWVEQSFVLRRMERDWG